MNDRIEDWGAYLGLGLAMRERDALRAAERTCRPLGGAAFLERVAAALGRDARSPRRGRPPTKIRAKIRDSH